jgi:SPOR domain
VRLEASFRAALTRILPGLPWHQAVAVVTTVWLLFMAAFALAMSQVTGGGDAVANARQVVVRGGAIAASAPESTPADSSEPTWNPQGDSADDGGALGGDELLPADDGLAGDGGFLPSVPLAEPLPEDTGSDDPGDGGEVPEEATWPAGKEAYTVLIGASQDQDEAQGKVSEAVAVGIEAGLLPSAGFASLVPDWYVVFAGQYDTLADAKKAADGFSLRGYTDSTPVYLSEDRVRRCEDGEQPAVITPAPTTPSQPAQPTPAPAPAETTPAPGLPPTTPAETTPTTPARPNDPAKGTRRQAAEDEPQVPALAALEKPCEVRARDDDTPAGDDSQTTTGPTVVP